MSNKHNALATIGPLFLVLFIDGMGLSLLFPVFNSIIIDIHSNFLDPSISVSARNTLYGFVVGIFMICWFFGAAILGDLSDKIGRKRSLLICLFGSFLGYLLSAIAIAVHSIGLVIVGRVIAGFTAGSQPIAQAAIVDISEPENKARNIGLIILSISLGFVIGPIIGGLLSDSNLSSWFNYATPMYFAAFISLLNAFLLLWLFAETFQIKEKIRIRLYQPIEVFLSAFQHKKVCRLSIVLLVMMYAWSNYFTFLATYVMHRFAATTLDASLMLTVMGVGFSIGSGYLVDFFTKRFALHSITGIAFIAAAVVLLLTISTSSVVYFWISLLPIGAMIAIGYSAIIAMFSNLVNENEQGWVMGVTGSISALVFGLTSLVSGYLINVGISVPMYLAVIAFAISGFALIIFKKNYQLVH